MSLRECVLVACAWFSMSNCTYYQAELTPEEFPESPDGTTPAASDIPCDVAALLSTYCLGCHSDPPRAGAPMPLVSRADLLADSPIAPGQTIGARAIARIEDDARPMPPSGLPGPSSEELAVLSTWVADGMPPGECEGNGGGNTDPTLPQPTTCSSGEKWPANWEDLDAYEDGSPDMNPGRPCRACHAEEEDDLAFFFMGTVFPTLHEEDRCYSDVAGGTVIEILDNTGAVALTLPVRQSGNFFSSSKQAQVALPFTARVVNPDGTSIQMNTPQMTGDCNACHTEQGANGAPGRILIPAP